MMEKQKKLVTSKCSENRLDKANKGLDLALFSEKIGTFQSIGEISFGT